MAIKTRSYLKNTSGCNSRILAACPKKFFRLTLVKRQNLFGANPLKILEFRLQIIFKIASNDNSCVPNEGYIALISVIIISFLLVTITAALSTANYFSRFNILENEFKIRSNYLAESCLSYARNKLRVDPSNYAGDELSVPIGGDTCSVVSVLPTGGGWPKTIKTQGIYPRNQAEESYTNLTVMLNSDFSINSWQETPN